MTKLSVYHLGNTAARRAGLTKSGYRGPSLLTINTSKSQSQNTMPGKSSPTKSSPVLKKSPIAKANMFDGKLEEDVNRLPDSDTSSEEEEEGNKDSADILNWDQIEARKKSRNEKQDETNTVNSKIKSRSKTQGPRTVNPSPSSNTSAKSQKRKSEKELPKLGANMVDAHGRLNVIGNKRPKYGSSSQRKNGYGKNLSPQKGEALSSPVTPKKRFQNPDIPSSSQEAATTTADSNLPKNFQKSSPDLDSPAEETEARKVFERPEIPESSPLSTEPLSRFKRPELFSSPTNDDGILLKQDDRISSFRKKIYDATSNDSLHSSHPIVSRPTETLRAEVEYPATQLPTFINYMDDLPDGVLETARAIISSNDTSLQCLSNSVQNDDTSAAMTQTNRCPLCNEPVDADDFKAYGDMNTREQGKFCLMHRRKTAKAEWKTKGYPEINWNKLDLRISKHHSFIKKLINGSDSHYRDLLEEKVNAGKDRNLRQMTSNLTPGYYGSRGLRAISENIMRKFTPLLKKRMIQDGLMSARGVNPYVQHVLVPELVALFIQEDMGVTINEARQILADSAAVGDLLNEELEDVVTQRIEDSEDD